MKEGWTYKKVGEVCEILDSQRKPITKGKREPGFIPYYGATGCLDYVKDYIFDEKLVLLGEDGAKWGAGENSAYIINGKSWVNNHAHALRPKRDLLIDELLVYYLNFSNLLSYITGVTVPKLNQEKMRSIEIPVGPIEEQQSIVDYLDSAFAKIDAMKANAEKALNEAKALFQASLKEMLEPKEGWEEKSLNEISQYSIGLTYKPSDVNDNGTIVLRSSNIQNDKIDLSDIVRVSCPIKEALFVQEGDILMCSRNGSVKLVGKVAIIPKTMERMTYGTFMMIIRGDYNPYLFYFFKSDDFRNQIKHGEANMINQITRYMLDEVVVNVPPLSEQESIVTTLDSLKAKVDRLQENFDKISQECDALKQAILRQVFE